MKKKVSLIIAGVMIVALVGGGGYLYIQNENAKEAALIQQQEAAEKAEAERIAAEKEAAEKAEAERLEEEKKAAEQEAEEQQQTTEATQPPAATEEPKATTDEQQPGAGANAGTGSDGLPDDVIIGSGNTYNDGNGNQIGQGNTSTVPNSPSTNDGEMSAEEWNAQLPPLQQGTEIGSPVIEGGGQVPGAGM